MSTLGEEFPTSTSEFFGLKPLFSRQLVSSYRESLPYKKFNNFSISNKHKVFVACGASEVIVGDLDNLRSVGQQRDGNGEELTVLKREISPSSDEAAAAVAVVVIGVGFCKDHIVYVQSNGEIWTTPIVNYGTWSRLQVEIPPNVVGMKCAGPSVVVQLEELGALLAINLVDNSVTKVATGVCDFDILEDKILYLRNDYSISTVSILDSTAAGPSFHIPEEMQGENTQPLALSYLTEDSVLLVLGEPPLSEDSEVSYSHQMYVVSLSSRLIRESFDIAPAFGTVKRNPVYYHSTLYEFVPNIKELHIIVSSCSSELTLIDDKEVIQPLQDADRAVLPINQDTDNDTNAVGLAIDVATRQEILSPCGGVEITSELPLVYVLNNLGSLECWAIFHSAALKSGELSATVTLKRVSEQRWHSTSADQVTENESVKTPLVANSPFESISQNQNAGNNSFGQPLFGSPGFGIHADSSPFASSNFSKNIDNSGSGTQTTPAFGSTGFVATEKNPNMSSAFKNNRKSPSPFADMSLVDSGANSVYNSAKPAMIETPLFGKPAFGNATPRKEQFGSNTLSFTGSAFGKPKFTSDLPSTESAFGKPVFTPVVPSAGSPFGKPSFGSMFQQNNSPFGNSAPILDSQSGKASEGWSSAAAGSTFDKSVSLSNLTTASPFNDTATSNTQVKQLSSTSKPGFANNLGSTETSSSFVFSEFTNNLQDYSSTVEKPPSDLGSLEQSSAEDQPSEGQLSEEQQSQALFLGTDSEGLEIHSTQEGKVNTNEEDEVNSIEEDEENPIIRDEKTESVLSFTDRIKKAAKLSPSDISNPLMAKPSETVPQTTPSPFLKFNNTLTHNLTSDEVPAFSLSKWGKNNESTSSERQSTEVDKVGLSVSNDRSSPDDQGRKPDSEDKVDSSNHLKGSLQLPPAAREVDKSHGVKDPLDCSDDSKDKTDKEEPHNNSMDLKDDIKLISPKNDKVQKAITDGPRSIDQNVSSSVADNQGHECNSEAPSIDAKVVSSDQDKFINASSDESNVDIGRTVQEGESDLKANTSIVQETPASLNKQATTSVDRISKKTSANCSSIGIQTSNSKTVDIQTAPLKMVDQQINSIPKTADSSIQTDPCEYLDVGFMSFEDDQRYLEDQYPPVQLKKFYAGASLHPITYVSSDYTMRAIEKTYHMISAEIFVLNENLTNLGEYIADQSAIPYEKSVSLLANIPSWRLSEAKLLRVIINDNLGSIKSIHEDIKKLDADSNMDYSSLERLAYTLKDYYSQLEYLNKESDNLLRDLSFAQCKMQITIRSKLATTNGQIRNLVKLFQLLKLYTIKRNTENVTIVRKVINDNIERGSLLEEIQSLRRDISRLNTNDSPNPTQTSSEISLNSIESAQIVKHLLTINVKQQLGDLFKSRFLDSRT
ncbi:FG-nucleoporin NUP159 Ecym_3291 [Eremothecium cymbalariae DBVPG|uniref:Nucleoporin Nup159/Nup146 N-terminal domain-containing protein n=1 Tax=Eremothecium cymbalariae (strain CBS 270.75 / DBVPG 7215 / KCTC 17166 / NRRL Y-17582) TaxID=931890 RepID=G8JRL5_ERECY|nr:Hypothetical protein Ecym_3291 [Eremothecium cymbalariae DBVPG\